MSWLKKYPSKILPLLDTLYNDEHDYVRRSVANHLNDISKDYPALVIERLIQWQQANPKSKNRQWIIRLASCSLVKASHPNALVMQSYLSNPPIVIKNFSSHLPNLHWMKRLALLYKLPLQWMLKQIQTLKRIQKRRLLY